MKLIDPLEKREWIYNLKEGKEKLAELGYLYLENGNYNDACECFLKAEKEEGLSKLKQMALEEGDTFLARKVTQNQQVSLDSSQWQKLAKKAEELGKYHFALEAYREAEMEQKVQSLQQVITDQIYHS